MVFSELVPTGVCLKLCMTVFAVSSLVTVIRMRWPAANRRALGTIGIR